MKTTEKGDIGRGIILADLLKRGLGVSLPMSEDSRYDLIVDKGGTLLRVQCKAAFSKEGALKVKCRSTSSWSGKTRRAHKYTATDIEVLAVVDLVDGSVFYIAASELGTGMSAIMLRKVPPKNGQKKGIRWASDYTTFP